MNKKMGFWMLASLSIGNMVGSGIYLLPSALAAYGSISLLAWGFTTVGAFLLALIFSDISFRIPKIGGPYAYAKEGFGDFIGFQTALNYWIGSWIGNSATVIAFVGYLRIFYPSLANPYYSCLVSISVIWILTFINIWGIRKAGALQLITTILKIFPIFLVAGIAFKFFNFSYITDYFNVSNSSHFSAFSASATLALWAFIGLESATIPAGNVINPKKNIPLATIVGLLVTASVYVVGIISVMGMIPYSELATAHAPFAKAAFLGLGSWGEKIVALGTVISCFGCLNGWIMLIGQVSMAAARDGLFPKIFAETNKADVPAKGLIVSAICTSAFLLLTISPDLVDQFELAVLMAVLVKVIPYLYTSMTELLLLEKQPNVKKSKIVITFLGSIFAIWAIMGSGEEIIYYGTFLMLGSIVMYALFKSYLKVKKIAD